MPLATILVEDNKTIRDSLIPAMKDLAGLEVVGIAETAGEAISLLEDQKHIWQLAVVDLFLREGTGLMVLRACQGRLAHQRVVVLTNYPTDEMRHRSKELGADAIFDKSKELEPFFDWCNTL